VLRDHWLVRQLPDVEQVWLAVGPAGAVEAWEVVELLEGPADSGLSEHCYKQCQGVGGQLVGFVAALGMVAPPHCFVFALVGLDPLVLLCPLCLS
jgi:hypothetical protein